MVCSFCDEFLNIIVLTDECILKYFILFLSNRDKNNYFCTSI